MPRFGDLFKMLFNDISPQIKDFLHLIMTEVNRSLSFLFLILYLLISLKYLLLIILGRNKLRVNLLTILLGEYKFQVLYFSQCWPVLSNHTKLFGTFRNNEISWLVKISTNDKISF